MPHSYDALVTHLRSAFGELRTLGLGLSLAKGRVGEILLAHELGHTLVPGDKGADGVDASGNRYEYKVSDDDQYNFFFGQWRAPEAIEAYLQKKLGGYAGSYCARLEEGFIAQIVYIPMTSLLPVLVAHLRTVKSGASLQKNHGSLRAVSQLPGASWIKE